MADYYTHFAFVVRVEHADWIEELWSLLSADWPDEGSPHPVFGPDRPMALPIVTFDEAGLRFFDDDGCSDIDATIAIIQWVLGHPGTPDAVEFTWADTCSKPRLDAFGGGTALITRNGATSVHTSSGEITDLLAARLARQHTSPRPNAPTPTDDAPRREP